MSRDDAPAYTRHPFPRPRAVGLDTLRWGRRRYHIPVLLEVDVTAARSRMRELKAAGAGIGFTAWVVSCVAAAAAEHPRLHALRHGRRTIVEFPDVSVTVLVERPLGADGERLPMPYVVRAANGKSPAAVHEEIRAAQSAEVGRGETEVGSRRPPWLTRLFTALPAPLRDLLFWRPMRRNAFLAQRTMGTVAVTSVGALGEGGAGWGIPAGVHPLLVAVGGIARRPGYAPGSDLVEPREYLSLTILFDHEVTDGAPAARFAARLRDLMAQGHGLAD